MGLVGFAKGWIYHMEDLLLTEFTPLVESNLKLVHVEGAATDAQDTSTPVAFRAGLYIMLEDTYHRVRVLVFGTASF